MNKKYTLISNKQQLDLSSLTFVTGANKYSHVAFYYIRYDNKPVHLKCMIKLSQLTFFTLPDSFKTPNNNPTVMNINLIEDPTDPDLVKFFDIVNSIDEYFTKMNKSTFETHNNGVAAKYPLKGYCKIVKERKNKKFIKVKLNDISAETPVVVYINGIKKSIVSFEQLTELINNRTEFTDDESLCLNIKFNKMHCSSSMYGITLSLDKIHIGYSTNNNSMFRHDKNSLKMKHKKYIDDNTKISHSVDSINIDV